MKIKDDFNWETYTSNSYGKILQQNLKNKRRIILNNFNFVDDELIINDDLHENQKQIYYLVNKLRIKSIFECGCGAAHHLINNQIINPDLIVNGCDYAQSQIDLGYKYFNLENYDFASRLKVVDMVNIENVELLGIHEFVYTQAVTMHLSYERAKKFLLNMKELSSKYILLIENTTMHDYDKLIAEVFPEFERIVDNKYINNSILLKRK